MKKLFIILVGWALGAPSIVWACDICGCSSGAQTLGLLPLVQRHLAGVRWQRQGYRTVAHGSEANSYEYFHSLDFWGRWMPHRRWQVMGFVPYSYNIRRFYDGQRQQVGGLGDVSLLAQFFILDPHQSMTHRWRHALQVGAGVKLPTGDFWMSESLNGQELPIPPALQPGTGSTDALVSALYAVSTHEWIISVDGMLRLTGQNSEGYRFGSRANGTLRFFHVSLWRKVTWMPYVGAQLDYRGSDSFQGDLQPETGGWVALAQVGAEVFAQDLAFGLSWSRPLAHELSSGFVAPQGRFSVSVTILMGRRQTAPTVLPPIPLLFPNVQPDTKPTEQ